MDKKVVNRRVAARQKVDQGSSKQGRTGTLERLSETQRKTIETLRRDALLRRDKRLEILKAYAKEAQGKKSKPLAPKPTALKGFSRELAIRASMPITAADPKSVAAFLTSVEGGAKATSLKFPDGLKHKKAILGSVSGKGVGAVIVNTRAPVRKDRLPSFGLDLSVDKKDGLQVMFRYRSVPGSLRLSDGKRAQGDLNSRLAAAIGDTAHPALQQTRGKATTSAPSRTDLDKAIKSGVDSLLSPDGTVNLLGYETIPLDDVAWQDFSEYLHALPLSMMRVMDPPEPNPEAVGILITVEKAGVDSAELSQFLAVLRSALWTRILTDVSSYILTEFPFTISNVPMLPGLVLSALEIMASQSAEKSLAILMTALQYNPDATAALAEIFWALPVEYRENYLNWVAATFRPADQQPGKFYFLLMSAEDINRSIVRWGEVKSLAEAVWGWALKAQLPPEEEPPEVIPPYNFLYFSPAGAWNLGLRLVYRQEWRPLGNQRGEVVKTIPLGPRQTEKVSTRITRRTKVVRTSEDLKSLETTSEMATSTKDSSETIKESSDTFKWHMEAEASANFGFGSASVSGGVEGSEENRLQQTDTTLSESSQKMASKIRRETKVTVSTESESTFEATTASEITNPNEEIAVTYVYSKLQRQYRLFTQLAEVHNVVMIAEPLPPPERIDDSWVKRHDSILAKVLLDDSYRDVLASFGQDRPQESIGGDALKAIEGAMDNVAGTSGYLQKIGAKAVSISLDSVDPSQEAQRGYRDTQKEELERKRARRLLVQKQRRFKQHVRDNLLHYYRAIWSSEDPQQRALRYRKLDIRVPLHWEFVLGSPDMPNVVPLDVLRDKVQRMAAGEIPYEELNGYFRPMASSEKAALADLINNAGPIGYEGNYAIYHVNPRFETTDLFLMLQILKAPYLDEDEFGQQTVIDPALKALRREHAGEGPAGYAEQVEMAGIVPELRLKHAIAKQNNEENAFFTVFRLTKDSLERMRAKGGLPAGLLSKLRTLLALESARKERNEDDFITFLGKRLSKEELEVHREVLLRYSDQGIFIAFYPEYLLRKRQGSPFLLDTGNLVIDIVPGKGSALESFKLMHRGIDVLKAFEEKTRMELENKRRDKLIDARKYGDPDIEKVTIVTGAKDAADLIAASFDTKRKRRGH